MASCNASKFLAPEESLLNKTKILFKNEKKVSDPGAIRQELTAFIDQQPNEKVLFFIPEEYLFLANTREGKSSWIRRGLKGLGKPPVLYDVEKCKKVAKNMENHLRYKKGFYHAQVDFLSEEKNKNWWGKNGSRNWRNSKVTYVVSAGDRYKVRSVEYDSEDTILLSHVQDITSSSYIKEGMYLDFTNFELEKSRITVYLQNHGYAGFANSFIEIAGDSSQVSRDVAIYVQIRTPRPGQPHSRYTTGEVHVYTDFYKDISQDSLGVDSIGKMSFFRNNPRFLVRPSLLYNCIFFKEGKLLSRDDRQKTFRKLSSLGTYSFVSVNSRLDTLSDSLMHFDVQLTPFSKKWIFDGGWQGYFSTLGAARLFGFSLSSQLVNRNLLGGSERYSVKAEIGSELGINPGGGIVRRTSNLSIQNNLNIPSFQDFVGLGRLAWRTGFIKDRFYQNFKEEATTNIGLGFSTLNIIDFYSINSYNASFGFDYTSPKGNRYVFRPLGFNLDLYEISDATRFQQNPLILFSFKDILGTGFLFRDLSYIWNKPKDRHGNTFFILNNLELSGWEVHLSNLLYNQLADKTTEWTIGGDRNIGFARYARYEMDARYNKEFSKSSSFAARCNMGVIVPFGQSSVTPFVKQFGVGGPNSLRAWNIKEPGPGGYRDPLSKIREVPVIFVNQGDIKLELNAEYRFKVLLFLDGAFFVDAGNVWTLKKDPQRPQSEISGRFLQQMAVAAGYGIRFNFDFFIIRFDLGYKIRSPYKDEYKSTQWYSWKEIRDQGIGNIQVAVNYPF
ncbi:MAG: BamA/TamA family outer membrane protein [Saprospiraceae bacterium]|jgi:outer membrane protein assembly factor BamA|nr:BamA/TamA family outer membrane protein [Saprospiraceae bacterium]